MRKAFLAAALCLVSAVAVAGDPIANDTDNPLYADKTQGQVCRINGVVVTDVTKCWFYSDANTVKVWLQNVKTHIKNLEAAVAALQGGVSASAPSVASFTPDRGTVGTSVNITGTNFGGASAVKFGGVAAVFTVASPTSITATVPSSASTGPISVTTAGGSASSSGSFTVASAASAPLIASFSSGNATIAPGQSATLTWSVSGATSLSIDHGVGTVTGTSTTVAPTVTTAYTLTATNGYGSTSAVATVTVLSVPTCSTMTPSAGSAGTTVNLTGTNMRAAAVTFSSSKAASISSFTDTAMTVTVPAGAVTGAVTVSNAAGSGSCGTFTVTGSTYTSIAIAPSTSTTTTGGSQTLTATVVTAPTTDTTLSRSANWSIATGCGSGSGLSAASGASVVFTAPATVPSGGSCTVNATTADGSKSASATMTITGTNTNVCYVYLYDATVAARSSTAVQADLFPNTAARTDVKWYTTPSSATAPPASPGGDGVNGYVDASGNYLAPATAASYKVWAVSKDTACNAANACSGAPYGGGSVCQDYMNVTVTAPSTSMTISATATSVNAGGTSTLNTSGGTGTVTWSFSANKSGATLDCGGGGVATCTKTAGSSVTYTAGSTTGVVDTVKAVDSAGTPLTATKDISVTAAAPLSGVYVSHSGNDSTGDGSSGNPYRTISKGVSVAGNSGHVIVRGGPTDTHGTACASDGAQSGACWTKSGSSGGCSAYTTADGFCFNGNVKGTAANPFIIECYTGEVCRIEPLYENGGTYRHVAYLQGTPSTTAYITFKNLIFDNRNAPPSTNGAASAVRIQAGSTTPTSSNAPQAITITGDACSGGTWGYGNMTCTSKVRHGQDVACVHDLGYQTLIENTELYYCGSRTDTGDHDHVIYTESLRSTYRNNRMHHSTQGIQVWAPGMTEAGSHSMTNNELDHLGTNTCYWTGGACTSVNRPDGLGHIGVYGGSSQPSAGSYNVIGGASGSGNWIHHNQDPSATGEAINIGPGSWTGSCPDHVNASYNYIWSNKSSTAVDVQDCGSGNSLTTSPNYGACSGCP